MVRQIWKIVNLILAVVVFAVSVQEYESLKVYAFTAAAVVAIITILNFVWLRVIVRNLAEYFSIFMPILFLAGLFGTEAAISTTGFKVFVGGVAAGMLYFYELKFPHSLPGIDEKIFFLSTGFLVAVSIWAFNFFFARPWWLISLLVMACYFVIFFVTLAPFTKKTWTDKTIWSLVSALVMVETSWMILFLPLHFLSSAVLCFSFFYLMHETSHEYLAHKLTQNKVYFQIGLTFVLIFLSLISSPWQPLHG